MADLFVGQHPRVESGNASAVSVLSPLLAFGHIERDLLLRNVAVLNPSLFAPTAVRALRRGYVFAGRVRDVVRHRWDTSGGRSGHRLPVPRSGQTVSGVGYRLH